MIATDVTLWDWANSNTTEAELAKVFSGLTIGPARRGPVPAGFLAARKHLADYDLSTYGRTRNFLDSPVSRLSPYLRHGMLTLVEVRDALKARYGPEPERLEEFLRQLAWRDFFEKVLDWHGMGLHEDLEPAKHSVPRLNILPPDIATGTTQLPCMDGMLAELFETGYLHNHERLWFAAYYCHYRGLDWQAGAKLFRQFLLDGDVASNSSSWQWVESTFAAKPYFMNRENIAKFSHNQWCATCTVQCPFDVSYEHLEQKLFHRGRAPLQMVGTRSVPNVEAVEPVRNIAPRPPACESLVWVHDAMLSPDDPTLQANPSATLVFVFDVPALQTEPWAFHRLAFVVDSVIALYQHLPNPTKLIAFGDTALSLRSLMTTTGAKTLQTTDHANPWVRAAIQDLHITVNPRPQLTNYEDEPKRFSRYWDKAASQVLGYRPKSGKKFHK
jgi:deoxyribodipyrimidine photo-lyase